MQTMFSRVSSHAMLTRVIVVAGICAFLIGCGDSVQEPITVRLVDQFDTAVVVDTVAIDAPEPMDWRFDGAGTLPVPGELGETYGWRALNNIEGLGVREGLLVGRTVPGDQPKLSLSRTDSPDAEDMLHAVEVRMRVSAGTRVGVWFATGPREPDRPRFGYSLVDVPLEPGNELHTYRLTNNALTVPLGVRHIQIEPTDASDATFAIESIRLISQREHLISIETGPGWYGLGSINREAIVGRSPQRVQFDIDLASRPWLDLAVGTIDDGPVTFTVEIEGRTLVRRTVTLPDQWEEVRIDLGAFARQRVTLSLGLEADQPGQLGFWGSPVVRQSGALPQRARISPARAALADAGASVPQGVILIIGDTLRRDHLDAYGYERPTAPVLARLAAEGALFADNISQAPWTKPSAPSILSSLYVSTHGVQDYSDGYSDRLPSSVATLAEAYRDAGYATFQAASHPWVGTLSGLQQGVEVLHEGASLDRDPRYRSKTARAYVTRFLDWLDGHNDVPFFAVLHFFDPHMRFEPYAPYDTMWATPTSRAEQETRWQILRETFGPGVDPYVISADLEEAALDREAFIAHESAWYDGSIRAMDVEIGRLLEGLEAHKLGDKTLVAFISDHGEELFDHGGIGHGFSAYGELLNVPLLVWWPGVVPAGMLIDDTVESIDLMPTLLDLSGQASVAGAQGQSLVPLMANPDAPTTLGWERRGAFAEQALFGGGTWGFTLVRDGWKLIHNIEAVNAEPSPPGFSPPPGRPEYELYDHDADPLDQRDVASEHPEVVEKLAGELTDLRQFAIRSRIPQDYVPMESLSSEELRRLRALGYLR